MASDILLAHPEIDDLNARSVLDDQVGDYFFWRLATLTCHLAQGLAGQWLQFLVLEADQDQLVRLPHRQLRVFRSIRLAHVGQRPCALRRVLEPRNPLLDPAGLDPERHGRVEPGRACRVGVHIRRDAKAPRPCRFDPSDRRVDLLPIVAA